MAYDINKKSPDFTRGASDSDPSKPIDDYSICRDIDKLIEEASDYRRKFENDWRQFEAFYDNRHWANNTEDKPSLNYTFSIVEYEVPLLTDTRPGTDVVALEEQNMDDAKVLEEAIRYVYNQNHIDLRLSQAIRQSLIATNHYLYADWNPNLENGNGAITTQCKNWRYVYLDPSEGDIDDMAYVIIKEPAKVDMLKRQFPEYADDIEPEDVVIDDMQDSTMYELQDRYHGPRKQASIGKFKPTDMCYLVEAWRKDYTMEPIPDDETMQAAQEEIAQIQQGIIPDVNRFMDHQKIIQILTAAQSTIVSNSQMRQSQAVQVLTDPNSPIVGQSIDQAQQIGADPNQVMAANGQMFAA